MRANTESLVQSFRETAGISRELRRPFRTMQEGLRSIIDAGEVIEGWSAAIDESQLDCGDLKAL